MEGLPVLVDVSVLREFAARVLAEAGMTTDEANIVADVLVWADVRGVESHGIMRLPAYVNQVKGGAIRSPAPIQARRVAPCLALMDGGAGSGQVVALAAMEMALELARETGAGIVAVRNSNHIGAAGYYAVRAAAAGCIGIVLTNADATMVPYGGRRRFFGTNPLAIAVPSAQPFPVVLDIATSAAAVGKIMLAAQVGKSIPEGWAVDREGRPTQDPIAALEGAVLPASGHKGSGLAFMIEALTAILAGGPYGPHVPPPNPSQAQGVSHLMVAIAVGRFSSVTDFKGRLDSMIADLHQVPPVGGFNRVLVPGELEGHTEMERRRTGIPLCAEVRKLLEPLGPVPWDAQT